MNVRRGDVNLAASIQFRDTICPLLYYWVIKIIGIDATFLDNQLHFSQFS